jgi:hypothetical protein
MVTSQAARRRYRDSPKGQLAARRYAAKWQREFRQTPEGKVYVRAMNLRKYGLTPEAYDAMLTSQGGLCAACRQPETGRNQFGVCRLAVDHDHDTGVVRGLLCMRCNRCLGLLGDSAERAQALALYRGGFS